MATVRFCRGLAVGQCTFVFLLSRNDGRCDPTICFPRSVFANCEGDDGKGYGTGTELIREFISHYVGRAIPCVCACMHALFTLSLSV